MRKHKWIHGISILFLLIGGLLRIYFHAKYEGAAPYRLGIWIPTEAYVWVRYLWLSIYPVSLNVDPDVPMLTGLSFLFWISLVLLLLLLLACWLVRKGHPFLSFWGLWFFLNLTSSSVVPLLDFMAEHRMYLSLFGFSSCVGYLLLQWKESAAKPRRLIVGSVIVWIAFLTFVTYQRNRVWASELTLWLDSSQKSPRKIRPHLNLAAAYIQRKAYDLAIQEYLASLTLNPEIPQTYSGLGICYLEKGDLNAADRNFRKALELHPDLIDAKTGMGVVSYRTGKYEESLSYFTDVYPMRQESARLLEMMSDAYLKTGKPADAIPLLKKGLALDPSRRYWHSKLIEAYLFTGQKKQAAEVYEQFRKRFPEP